MVIVIGGHLLSLIVIEGHWLSLIIVFSKKNDARSANDGEAK